MKVLNKISTLSAKSLFLGTLLLSSGVVSASSEFPGAVVCEVNKVSNEATLSKQCKQPLGKISGKQSVNVNLYVGGYTNDQNIIGYDYNRYVGLRFYRNGMIVKQYRKIIPKVYITEGDSYKAWHYTYEEKYRFTTNQGEHVYHLEASTTTSKQGSFRMVLSVW